MGTFQMGQWVMCIRILPCLRKILINAKVVTLDLGRAAQIWKQGGDRLLPVVEWDVRGIHKESSTKNKNNEMT